MSNMKKSVNIAAFVVAVTNSDENEEFIFIKRNWAVAAKEEIEKMLKRSKVDAAKAAAALGSIKSEKKARSSAENGKKGGRPKKEQE